MIPKEKGQRDDPGNYRPFCLGKLIEHIVFFRMYHSLERQGFFAINQSGFRSCRRTTDNLFFLSQKVREVVNKKKKVCCVLFDVQKAFDNVWHAGLLHKMISPDACQEMF